MGLQAGDWVEETWEPKSFNNVCDNLFPSLWTLCLISVIWLGFMCVLVWFSNDCLMICWWLKWVEQDNMLARIGSNIFGGGWFWGWFWHDLSIRQWAIINHQSPIIKTWLFDVILRLSEPLVCFRASGAIFALFLLELLMSFRGLGWSEFWTKSKVETKPKPAAICNRTDGGLTKPARAVYENRK